MATPCYRLLIIGLLLLLSPASWAASATMEVRIWVMGGCKFVSGDDVVMNFGDLNQGDRTITANVPITCINGTQFNVTLNNGLNANGTQRQMAQNGGTGRLPYTLTASPQTGESTGSDINIELRAQVKQADYQSRPVGQYSDTVVMTIDP